MIVALAGHVDHGKTTLVRMLTGTDTDRLAEERRRGLTIDLGFAYLEHADQVIGFVDVPGHHRFIHNMVAGIAAEQFALLAIAADDGPMPQSREHLQILSLIGVRRGLVALTKSDRVDAARLAAARHEVEALVADTFLAGCAVIPTAATGAGLDDLRDALLAAARSPIDSAADRPFRMAIDRAFTLKGTGVVVTGTLHAGRVTVDQEVWHFPSGRRTRIRSLRVQNRQAQSAGPGDRAALNLVGLDVDDIQRGDWLTLATDPGHRHLVIELELLGDFPRALRPWLPVHVYHATRHTTARLATLQPASIESPVATASGAAAGRLLAELDCAEPLLVRHGDRLVIRDQGLDRTLGGGRVIDNRVRPRRRHAPARLASIAALQRQTPIESLTALLELGAVDINDFQRIWDLEDRTRDALCASLPATRHGRSLILDATWTAWSQALLIECESRHAADAALQGLQENAFSTPMPSEFRGELLRGLVAAGSLEHRAGRYRPARHEVQLSPQEATLLAKVRPLLALPQPMSLGDIAKKLQIALPLLQKSVRPLVAKGVVVQINDKRLYLPDAIRTLAEHAQALSTQGSFTAAQFRDKSGIGRNSAVDVLEYFDARRFTRRQGEVRSVVGDPGSLFGS